jgi:POT family proton-dependent oligopeptide transporter
LGILTSACACQKQRWTQHSATVHNQEDRSFIGHPRGLGYIAFTEAWERFSYYGMQTLLVLYMTHRLLLPGHVEHVAGFERFRQMLETLYHGHLDIQPLASAIFGLYTGLVYLTPIAGGLLADRFLGRTRTITIGAILMSAGHFSNGFRCNLSSRPNLSPDRCGLLQGQPGQSGWRPLSGWGQSPR